MRRAFATLACRLGGFVLLCLAAATAQAATLQGTVFEDRNYGGGAGRSLSASGGVGVANVRIELYSAAGAFLGSTTTGAGGTYSISYGGNAAVTIRAVNGTVRSGRTGGAACTTCVPVQTFRTVGSGNTANAVTNFVGGQTPALSDAPSNTSNASLASLTTATQTPQSIAVFDPTANNSTVLNVDFGFNFSTIVNVRDAAACAPSGTGNTFYPCQGSLRQFIINSNALGGEASLAQSGSRQLDGVSSALPSSTESSIFMVPNGAANPGQNTGYANALNGSGVAEITLATAFPTLSGAGTRLDATTQTVNVGNTNAGTLGSGGTVGVDNLTLPLFQRPEVQLNGAASAAPLTLGAANQAIHGFALRQGYILLAGSAGTARNNLVGMTATGSSADVASAFYGITFQGTNSIVRGNFVTVNNSGIRSDGNAGAGSILTENEVARPSSGHTNTFDGILMIGGSSNTTVSGNLARDQRGGGIEIGFGAASDVYSNVTISNNTVRNNGFNSGTTPSTEDLGMAAYNLTANNVSLSRNRIEDNAGPGIVVLGASGITISQNRFSNNRTLAIDLDPVTRDPNGLGTPNGVTINDANDTDSGPNGLLNFPVITNANIVGSELQIRGFARPGSRIELYIAQPDASGFGEGLTYLTALTEGSGTDLAAGTGSYGPGNINGLAQGSDTTNLFAFRLPLPGGVAIGTVLTATATLSGNTSEFNGNVVVQTGPALTHLKSVAVTRDPINDNSNPKSIPGSEQLYTLRVTNTGAGSTDAGTVTVIDPIPTNTQLFVGDLAGAGLGPVTFTNGTPSSGLGYSFVALADLTDSLDFSNDGGATWTFVPTPDPAGYNAAVTHIRVRLSNSLAGNSGSGNPWFELRFRVRVN